MEDGVQEVLLTDNESEAGSDYDSEEENEAYFPSEIADVELPNKNPPSKESVSADS